MLRQDRARLQRSFLSIGKADQAGRSSSIDATPTSALPGSSGSAEAAAAAGDAMTGVAVADGLGEGISTSAVGQEATVAFWEVLSYSRLMEDSEIEQAFLAALTNVGVVGRCCVWRFGRRGSVRPFPERLLSFLRRRRRRLRIG